MTNSILVTGASGFVGHALCAELVRRQYSVSGAIRGDAGKGSYSTVRIADIGPDTDWTAALQGVGIVIHLAARVHVMHDDARDPLAAFQRTNTAGTEHLVRCAAAAEVKRLVYVSSIKVNGEETAGRQSYTEQDVPSPQDPYGVSKWEAEQALQRVAHETGLEVVVVRPPLVYGPGVKGNFISLLAAVNKGLPLPLAGADNARSLVYVGNLVDALIACATHPTAAGQTYLVSDGVPVSTATLVDKIAGALGCRSRSFYFPPALMRIAAAMLGRSAQVDRLFGSLRINDEKIRRELGWVPPYTLEQGLRATAEWYRGQR